MAEKLLMTDDKIVWKDFQDSFTRLFDILLLFTGVVAVLLLAAQFFGLPGDSSFIIICLVIAGVSFPFFIFRKKTSPVIKLWVVTALLCFFIYLQFSFSGSTGAALIYLVSLQMLQIVFHQFKKVLPFLLISSFSLLVIGLLSRSGFIIYAPYTVALMQSFSHWVNLFIAVVYFVLICSFTVYGFKGKMLRTLNRLKEYNDFLKVQKSKLKLLAYYDHLTRLPNRHWFYEELERRKRQNGSLSGYLILSDIMNFRTVNSFLGPEKADDLLRMIGRLLRNYSGENILVGRLNGVEFVGWVEGWSEETLRQNIQTIRSDLKSRIHEFFPGFPFDVLVAAAEYPVNASSFSELYQNCVTAMSQAKLCPHEEITFFTPAMSEVLNREIQLQNDLENALVAGDFLLYYQEQVNIRTNAVTGLEVLSRWQNGTTEFISPDVFIPILTKYNLIIQFSQLLFIKVLEDMPFVVSRYGREITVSVNISPIFFLSDGFSEFIKQKLTEYDVNPSSIILEITEDVFIEDLSKIKTIIEKVRALGVSVSLDDFGKGFSSLSYLSRLQLNEVKIDREFINTILEDDLQFGVVKSICDLAKILGYEVVIEGIETEEQVQKIRETSCDVVQGYFYSRPQPLSKEPALSSKW